MREGGGRGLGEEGGDEGEEDERRGGRGRARWSSW